MEINPVQPIQGENPIVIFPDSIYGGNGDRSFSNNPQYISDNPQSTIILPTGGTVTVRIISSEAAGDAKIDLLQNQPEQQTLTEYANHYLGFNWTSQFYPPGTNVEFGIYWYWNYYGTIYEGNEAGAIVTQLSENKYEIGFEAAGDDWDYNELIIQVTIEDFELLVDINPSEISTGETAVVTVKKQFYDGRVEDFPAGQLFEFGMMEGCVAGGLVSGTDTAAYFNGVTQPILFVAADSLENDEETVRIGVGLVEQIIARPINSINKTVQKGILSKTTDEVVYKEKEISDVIIIGGACSGVELNSTKQSFANVVVGGSICKKLPKCTENNAGKKPEIEVLDFPLNYGGSLNLCQKYEADGTLRGFFMPLYRAELAPSYWENYTGEKLFYNFQLELCFDDYAGVIQFGIKNNNLILKSIVGYCGDYLPEGVIEINNIGELRTKISQDAKSILEAIKIFEKLKTYRGGYPYTVEEVVWAHELKHLANYKTQIVDEVNKEKDLLNYSKFDIACSRNLSLKAVEEEMIGNFEENLSDFEIYLVDKQNKKWGSK